MTRTSRLALLGALLSSASIASAQTARDSAHTQAQAATLDSLERSVLPALTQYCATKSAVGYMKQACPAFVRLLTRLQAAEASFLTAPIPQPTPVPIPTPDPVPDPVPDPTPPPPSDSVCGIATCAELPRSVPTFAIPAPTRIVVVSPPMDLQAALNNAQRGDELRISGSYTGNFTISSCGAGWITVSGTAARPPTGARMRPSLALGLGKIISPNTEPAIATKGPACRWAFRALEVVGAFESTAYLAYGIIRIGEGGDTQRTLASVPYDFLLEQLYVHGAPNHNNTRCLVLNSANTAVVDSWISDCHARGSDSQAIEGWNGPGPFLIENNTLEGAGENIMFGGADPGISNLSPSDITIRRNHIAKPLGWRGGPWSIKNLFELKNARRVLLEANVLERSWPASQEGMAIVIKSSGDVNAASTRWQGTADVTLRWNVIRDAAVGLNLQAIDCSGGDGCVDVHVQRVTVQHNLFDAIGADGRAALMLFTHDLSDVSIRNNTFQHHASVGTARGAALVMDYGNGQARRLEWRGNVLDAGAYGLIASGECCGTVALESQAGSSWVFRDNAIVGGAGLASRMPTGNTYPSTRPTTGGVDVAELTRRTLGVVVAP